MSNYIIQGETLTSLADSIRAKGGITGAMTPAEMKAAVDAIQTGGGSGSSEKDVNFYDYDGTLLHAYTVAEAQALSELPAGPEHEGLVFQKWNWSLENVKALTRPMNIGAQYTTDDGTTRIYIRLKEGYTSPMLGIGVMGTVTVDWGDGTAPDVLTASGADCWTPNHNYAAPGDYVIRLTVDGTGVITSTSYDTTRILRHTTSANALNERYANAVRRIELGDGVKLNTYALEECGMLESLTMHDGCVGQLYTTFLNCRRIKFITIPEDVTNIGNLTFADCCFIEGISLPDSLISMGNGNVFSGCSSLKTLTIPESVIGEIPATTFLGCYSLEAIRIPSGITTIGMSAFSNCYKMRSYDFTQHTNVPRMTMDDAFMYISEDCEIRVPDALYDEWIAATNWATYASQIVAV